MRIKLSPPDREKLFPAVLERKKRWKVVAKENDVSTRTLHDWRSGKLSMPQPAFRRILKCSGLKRGTVSPLLLQDFWHIREAARSGGFARQKLYGDLGTAGGRRKGGLASMIVHRKNKTGFTVIRRITTPSFSGKLAELLGIFFGDGHLSQYQGTVTTNLMTDYTHALYVKKIIVDLFNLKAQIKKRKNKNAVIVIVSSKRFVDFLCRIGMPRGNKMDRGLQVPDWVVSRPQYKKMFLRGLFDTDGCIYLDSHRTKKATYYSLGWTFTSYVGKFLNEVADLLRSFGFSPTFTAPYKSIFLRKRADIHRYFRDIGTSNPKHSSRYRKFKEGCAER